MDDAFNRNFRELAHAAGIRERCKLNFSERMRRRNDADPRAFAEVDPHALEFHFAPQILSLPEEHQRGLIAHELGHVLCRDMEGGGTEKDADDAAWDCLGIRIEYDCRWPGKGLQRTENPPYSGYRKDWPQRPLPKDTHKLSYRTKADALNVFLDYNRAVVDDYGGESMKHSPESFEAINHQFDIKGKRRVDNIAKAVWWALPAGSPYYLEDIDVELLNRTAPALYNPRGLQFQIPDYAEEAALIEKEAEYWMEKYGDVEYPTEVPF